MYCAVSTYYGTSSQLCTVLYLLIMALAAAVYCAVSAYYGTSSQLCTVYRAVSTLYAQVTCVLFECTAQQFPLIPANVFAESLTDVWELLPSDSRIALNKYIITAHTIEWLRDSIYGWSDTRKEPLLRHMHYEKFESHSNCSVFQCVLYVSTLSDGLQLWRVHGRHCFGLGKVEVSHLEELANSVVTSNTAPRGMYPPFNNGTKGNCLSKQQYL